MRNKLKDWLLKKYPRNYLIENPLMGGAIIFVFSFTFLMLYRPLGTHASKSLNYAETMAVYSAGIGISIFLFARAIDFFKWFSVTREWTILKEMVSILAVITATGIVVWVIGFFVEIPADRLNLGTILNSAGTTFLLSIIPFLFFSALNYRYLMSNPDEYSQKYSPSSEQRREALVHISSQLKKEELNFYPDELIYAEADGNYVIFHLIRDGCERKEMIRTSITRVENEMSTFPYFFRTHRAFIVNLNKIKSRQGNMLGYQLRLAGADFIIPVSRSNIKNFELTFSRFHK